jgi:hypothetical protein
MENRRTNEVLNEQIAIIQEFAPKLETTNLKQLEINLLELERAVNTLKDFLKYLPK